MSTSRSIGERSFAVVAAALALALVLTGCSSGSKLGAVLAKGASEASTELRPLTDDLLHAAQSGEVKAPGALTTAGRSIPSSGLSEAERAAAAKVQQWLKTVEFWNGAVAWATGWESGLPDESVALVRAALRADVDPAFARQVDDLAERLLRSATCQTARQLIDSAAEEAADPAYELSDPVDEPGMVSFLRAVLYDDWDADSVEAVVDLAALGSSVVGTVKKWSETLTAVYESPNGTVRQANVFYLRSCVAKA